MSNFYIEGTVMDMDNVNCIVQAGMCTGCGACNVCNHITFGVGSLGFPVPIIGEDCIHCRKCLSMCIFDPSRDDDE